jgi:uncharacterized protein
MKTPFLSLILGSLIPFAAAAQTDVRPVAPAATVPDTITVVGKGRVTATPDRVSFTAGVQTQAPTVEAAVNQNNQLMERVIAALKAAGVPDADLRTTGFGVHPQYDHRPDGRRPEIVGFQVMNNVHVSRSDAAAASRLLTVALGAGANQVSGLSFSYRDRAAAEGEGLQAALTNARAKAALLAQSAGRTLGRTMAVVEGGAQPPPMPMYRQEMMVAAARVSDVPVEAGTDELEFVVTAVFEIR